MHSVLGWLTGGKLKKETIWVKLFALFLVPLLVFLIVSLVQLHQRLEYAKRISGLEHLVDLAIHISTLVHETQKERGATGIYLSSHGTKFLYELRQQRRMTDRRREELLEHIADNHGRGHGESFERAFERVLAQLEKLDSVRLSITELDIPVNQGLAYYTEFNSLSLNAIGTIVNDGTEPELTRAIVAYVNYLKAKERAGIERAIISATFTQDFFSPGIYQRFIQLVTEQDSYHREFVALASQTLIEAFNKVAASDYFRDVQQYRDVAHENARRGGFGVDSAEWFKTITLKIDQLKTLEDRIADELVATTAALKARSTRAQWLWVGLIAMCALVAIVVGVRLMRQITDQFNRRLNEYRNLFEHSAAGMVVVNPSNHRFLFSNSTFARMLGFDQAGVAGLFIADILPVEKIDINLRQLKRLTAGDIDMIKELPLQRRDGSEFEVEITAFPVIIAEQHYVACNIRDITQRRAAEIGARRSQQTLQTVLDSLDAAVSVIDPNTTKTIYLNKRANILRDKRDEVEPVWSLLDPEYRACSVVDSAAQSTAARSTEKVYNQQSKRWYEIKNNVIDWHDERMVCLRMLEDITERYEAEHKNKLLLDENRRLALRNYDLQEYERRQLAAELHDQLGQLMTGIMFQVDFIQRRVKDQDPELKAAAADVAANAGTVISSIRNVTNRLRPVILDQLGLVDALSELVQGWQDIRKDTQFEFRVKSIVPSLPDKVSICAYRIAQESLTNANKHAKAKHIRISLKYEKQSPVCDSPVLVLSINDDGVGMDEQKQFSGGMGVVNMRERVKAFGGVFRLVSKPEGGIEIVAYIPVNFPENKP